MEQNRPSGQFEKKLKRLEEIVAKLEGQEVTLDEAVGLFKEGKILASECNALLAEADKVLDESAGGGKGEVRVPAKPELPLRGSDEDAVLEDEIPF